MHELTPSSFTPWPLQAPDNKQDPTRPEAAVGMQATLPSCTERRSYGINFFATDMPSSVAIEGETTTTYEFDIYYRIVYRKRRRLTAMRLLPISRPALMIAERPPLPSRAPTTEGRIC
jgi:hypothetical protein